MAIEAFKSIQETEGVRKRPTDDHGKFRLQFFQLAATTVVGDIGSTIDLCELPPGAVRIIPNLSRIIVSAWGAARTLSVGHRAYSKRPPPEDGSQEAQSANVFINALDVSAGPLVATAWSTVLKYDVYSLTGVMVYGTVAGGTIPIGATLSGFCTYIYE